MRVIVEVVELEALDGLPFPAHASGVVENSARLFAGASAEAGRRRHFTGFDATSIR